MYSLNVSLVSPGIDLLDNILDNLQLRKQALQYNLFFVDILTLAAWSIWVGRRGDILGLCSLVFVDSGALSTRR
jgi:hypothetical protein